MALKLLAAVINNTFDNRNRSTNSCREKLRFAQGLTPLEVQKMDRPKADPNLSISPNTKQD